ncbi:MAG: GHKL domain-containing protein, partial [Coleofasciculus sp. Co-bin14]|nr:GHKL domain-containing protein [Coleofasciculus sp. Co-bin14]
PSDREPITNALQGKSMKVDDMEIRRPDKIIPIESSGTPIYDESGNLAYAIVAFQDITQRKKAEQLIAEYNHTLELQVQQRTQELKTALDHLKATQEELIHSEKMVALGQLVAGVAHEINTPLAVIRSSIGNIADFLTKNLDNLPTFLQKLSPECQQYFWVLLSKSRQNTILLSSKEKRQFKKHLKRQLEEHTIDNADGLASTLVTIGVQDDIQPFLPLLKDPDSETILKTAYELASVQISTRTIATAIERAAKVVFALKSYAHYDHSGEKVHGHITVGIETVLTLYHNQLKQGVEVIRNYEEVPSIWCYPDELNQVWTNLVHNALQAMDYKGTLRIELTLQEPNLLISITDSGKGIPPEIMPKIFEPFFTTKPVGEGSGLGLHIVKQIVEKHQGNIEFDSVPGKTTFTVLIPINS